jgi:hypothetical protein
MVEIFDTEILHGCSMHFQIITNHLRDDLETSQKLRSVVLDREMGGGRKRGRW